jgi:hypothetical protein
MKLSAAIAHARKWARKDQIYTYVWLEEAELDEYVPGDDIDADTYFGGQPPAYVCAPDGEIMTYHDGQPF